MRIKISLIAIFSVIFITALFCFSIFLYLKEPPIILNLTNYRAELKPPFTPPASSSVNLKKVALVSRTSPKLPPAPAKKNTSSPKIDQAPVVIADPVLSTASKSTLPLSCANKNQRIPSDPARIDLSGKSGLIIDENNLSYDIRGTNSQEVQNQLSECTVALEGVNASGVTSSTINYSYDFETIEGQVCEIKNVAVGLNLSYLLPRLVDAEDAPSDLKNKWKSFYGSLREHEDEHGRITKNYAETFYTYLKDLSDEKKCVSSQENIEDAFNKVMKDLNVANDRYDDETDHGRNEGVQFSL